MNNRSMNVLYFCPEFFSNSGARTHAREFFESLQNQPEIGSARVFNIQYQAKKNPEIRKAASNGLGARVLKFARAVKPRPEITQEIIDEIRDQKIDLMVVRKGAYNLIYHSIKKAHPGTSICMEINAFRSDEHYRGKIYRDISKFFEFRLLRHVDAYSVVSSYLKEYLVQNDIPAPKVIINPNGVNLEVFKPRGCFDVANIKKNLGISTETLVIGYVGGMERFKRLPLVVERLANMRENGFDDFHLVIVGDGEDYPNVARVIDDRRRSLNGNVTLLGWQPYEKVPEIMSTLDVAVFPFTNPYCSPLKLFECLAMELPTVGPDLPGVRDVFQDGKHLFLVKQDGSNLEKTIVTLKNDPDLRRQIGENGSRYVREHFTWQHNSRRLLTHMLKIRQSAPDFQFRPVLKTDQTRC